ncbi:MAG TPA: 3-phosphoshikimate 1-carboxyvinyltransferase [Gemmatimonadales bacterium]|nr:3-phosphoshikimate 1-carboxyvinyltransferase [Gemmatimonadales bacterium]
MQVGGTIRVPGDKSLSHRALLLAAMARGTSHVGGILPSLDVQSSARVLRRLGAEVSPIAERRAVRVTGRGRLRRPETVLDCGNSGTTTRLLLGLLAAHRFPATLTGDRSLRRRPMRRVTLPLSQMGARFIEHAGNGLPLTVHGGRLVPLRYEMPVSSAQIKSALLLAGVAAGVPVSVREPGGRSRDHTERLLRNFGYQVEDRDDGWIHFEPTGELEPFELQVPGDPSSAIFPVAAALLAERGELRITGVCLNPTRTGFIRVLARMGAPIEVDGVEEQFGELVGDLVARPAGLRATEVEPHEIPGLIDEIPMLAALATRARGTTVFRQVGELRVKESDRLGLLAANIRALGGQAEVEGDDLYVIGSDAPPRGRVVTEADHRLAMAFTVLGTVPGARVRVDNLACARVSYPGFSGMLREIRKR